MNNLDLTQIEFDAKKLINDLVNEKQSDLEIMKISNGYALKDDNNNLKVLLENSKWYLVVKLNEKEYFFDGSNSDFPFKNKRHYDDWNVHFEEILKKQ